MAANKILPAKTVLSKLSFANNVQPFNWVIGLLPLLKIYIQNCDWGIDTKILKNGETNWSLIFLFSRVG